jgi:hypothetical protein
MWDVITKIIVALGIPSIVVGCIYIGKKLQILDDLKEAMNKVKHNIKVIADSLVKQKQVIFDPSELQAYSPLRLTAKGNEKIKEVEFDSILKKNKKDFLDFIALDEPKTRYDVQNSAIKSIISLFDNEYFTPVKKYLYNHPDVDIKRLTTTLAIYLRDKYLEEHVEIKE